MSLVLDGLKQSAYIIFPALVRLSEHTRFPRTKKGRGGAVKDKIGRIGLEAFALEDSIGKL